MITLPLACLLFFAAWTLGLVLVVIAPYRVGNVLLRKTPPNGFPAGAPHGPEWYQRTMRAHANCVENLPVYAVVVVVGHLVGLHDGGFATAALVTVICRVGQTLAHVSSGRSLVVNIRFTFFIAQVAAVITMGSIIVQQAVRTP